MWNGRKSHARQVVWTTAHKFADTIATGNLSTVLSSVSMLSHLEQLTKGLLHIKDVVYFLTFIGFFVFATQQRVEAFRWR